MEFSMPPLALIDHVFVEEQLAETSWLIMLVTIAYELEPTDIRNLFELVFDWIFLDGMWNGWVNIIQNLCYFLNRFFEIYQIFFNSWDEFGGMDAWWWFSLFFDSAVMVFIEVLHFGLNDRGSWLCVNGLIDLEMDVLLIGFVDAFSVYI